LYVRGSLRIETGCRNGFAYGNSLRCDGIGHRPVSVIALFREVGVDKRLTMILEGESLFNDGTAVVLFQLVLAVVAGGGDWSLGATILSFIIMVAGGAAVGCAAGYLASLVTRLFDDHLLEITLTVATAFGSYLIATTSGCLRSSLLLPPA